MARQLKEKVVVVTGGATGIGFAIADSFLRNGAHVAILLDINETHGYDAEKQLNTTYGHAKAVFLKCDVTKDLDTITNKIVGTYKTIDVLINSAGAVSETNPRKTIELNLLAVIEWSLKCFEHMRTDRGGKGGTIINMSSIYGFVVDPYLPLYKASKYGVIGFTKTKGHSYNFNKTGVRLVAICPGVTRTNLISDYESWEAEENRKDFVAHFDSLPWQDSKAVADAAVEVFQKADSGTAWLVQGGDQCITEV